MKKGQIRVIIADDHVMVRSGLRLFLLAFEDLKLVGEAANGEEAIRLCAREKADVVLMDMVIDRKSTRLNSSHLARSRMPSSA